MTTVGAISCYFPACYFHDRSFDMSVDFRAAQSWLRLLISTSLDKLISFLMNSLFYTTWNDKGINGRMPLLGVSGPKCILWPALFFLLPGRGVEKTEYSAIQGNDGVLIAKVPRLTAGHLNRIAHDKIRTYWPDTDFYFPDSTRCNLLLYIVWVEWKLFWVLRSVSKARWLAHNAPILPKCRFRLARSFSGILSITLCPWGIA